MPSHRTIFCSAWHRSLHLSSLFTCIAHSYDTVEIVGYSTYYLYVIVPKLIMWNEQSMKHSCSTHERDVLVTVLVTIRIKQYNDTQIYILNYIGKHTGE